MPFPHTAIFTRRGSYSYTLFPASAAATITAPLASPSTIIVLAFLP